MCVSVLSIVLSWNAIHVSLSNNFTRNEREAGVGLSRARAISLESGGSLFNFCRPPWWVHRLFIFAPDISREGNENFRARSKGASEFSLSLSSDFSFWFLNSIIMYYLLFLPVDE